MSDYMCFDCEYRNIIETEHEWIECKCRADGRWHSPYAPAGYNNGNCPNYSKDERKYN